MKKPIISKEKAGLIFELGIELLKILKAMNEQDKLIKPDDTEKGITEDDKSKDT